MWFGGIAALDKVDFELRRGEVHALVGENGAGKSTLMKILSGVHPTYEGTISLQGRPARFSGVRQAEAAGIAMIHQELNLVPELTVAENIFLGREPRVGGLFIGGDNKLIGQEAGAFAVELLGGPGKAEGNAVEIWGGLGTQPARDRHDGFHEMTDKEPGIKYLLDQQSADWKQDQAYNIMATALRNHEDIDLVYGHNDPMAFGAYLTAKDVGREDGIKFIGIDALPNEGVQWVHDGQLSATFLYPTPGAEGLRQALKYLNGEDVEKTITLDTKKVTRENADEILKENGLL